MKTSKIKITALVIAAFALSSATQAADYIWNGTSSNSYKTATNWLGGSAPANAVDSNIFITSDAAGTSAAALRFDVTGGPTDAGSVTFNSTAADTTFTLGVAIATGLRLNGDITNSSTNGKNFTITGNGFTFIGENRYINTTGGNITIGSIIAGTSNVIKTGAYNLVLNGVNTLTGNTIVQEGTVVMGKNEAFGTGNLILNGGTLETKITHSTIINNVFVTADSTIEGNRSVYSAGGGALTHAFGDLTTNASLTLRRGYNVDGASAANTYTFNTTVIKNGAAFTFANGAANLNGNATLAKGTATFGLNGNTILSGTSNYNMANENIGAGTFNMNGTNVKLTGDTTLEIGENVTVNFNAAVDGEDYTLTKNGAGTLLIAGSNGTYGNVTLNDGWLQYTYTPVPASENTGKFLILNGGQFSTGTGSGKVFSRSVSINGDVIFGSDVTGKNGSIGFAGPTYLNGSHQVTVLSEIRFGGNMYGTGYTLTKVGAGDLYLNGTVSSDTHLSEGNLYIAGNHQGNVTIDDNTKLNMIGTGNVAGNIDVQGEVVGALNIANGKKLSGTGTLDSVTIASGGILSPGNSPGSITIASLTLEGTAIMEIASASSYDKVIGLSNFAINGGTLEINFTSTLSTDASFDLFSTGSSDDFAGVSLTGAYSASMSNSTGDWVWEDIAGDTKTTFTFATSSGILSVAITQIPEPTTYAAILGALAILALALRRRNNT